MKYCKPSVVKRYKGTRPPTCNNGNGCTPCLVKYNDVQGRKVLAALLKEEFSTNAETD